MKDRQEMIGTLIKVQDHIKAVNQAAWMNYHHGWLTCDEYFNSSSAKKYYDALEMIINDLQKE